MRGSRSISRLTGLGLAFAIAGTGVAATATTAGAAGRSTAPAVWGLRGGVELGPAVFGSITPTFRTAPYTSFHAKGTVTIDARGLRDVVDVTFGPGCVAKGLVATCADTFDAVGNWVGQIATGSQMSVHLRPGVKTGAHGSYRVSAVIPALKVTPTLTGEVQVGAPELKASKLVDHEGLPVGSVVSEPVTFTNAGARPSAGAEVLMVASPGMSFAHQYRNCDYQVLPSWSRAAALCRFPGVKVLPGETLALSRPVDLKVGRTVWDAQLSVAPAPADDPDLALWWGGGKPGKGGALGLKVVKPGRATTLPASDIETPLGVGQGAVVANYHARNTADFAAWAGTPGTPAKQGDTVSVTLGVTNLGPATIWSYGRIATRFVAPTGTSVVTADSNCKLENPAVPGVYDCVQPQLVDFWAGDGLLWKFDLRVDTAGPHPGGSFGLQHRLPFDPNPGNDTTAVVLK